MRAVAAARSGHRLSYKGSAAPETTVFVLRQPTLSGAAISPPDDERSFIMDMDKELEALLFQQWSNGACRGYVIYAMENCGFPYADIRRIVSELHYVFDMCSLEEAKRHYQDSRY